MTFNLIIYFYQPSNKIGIKRVRKSSIIYNHVYQN